MKKVFVVIAIAVFAQLLTAQAFAQAPNIKSLEPFHFGPGGLSGWQQGAGNSASGGSDALNYGLYLQKSVPTATLTAAGADVVLGNVPAANTITNLSFTISGIAGQPFGTGSAYCGAGAPRWTVITSSGTCFLGCAAGAKTQLPSSGWWEIKFTPPFDQYPGCAIGLATAGQTISNLFVIMDEGTDVGPGNVVVDDITINTRKFLKP